MQYIMYAKPIDLDIIDHLVKSNVDINQKDSAGCSALIMAAVSRAGPQVFRSLIEAGADVNCVDR